MECRLCNRKSNNFAPAVILKKHHINYYLCENCGLLQTENPDWLSEAYQEPVNTCDTGILQRNIELSQKTAVLLYALFNPDYKCLDYAGGYGIFCRLMRDLGFDYFWQDPYAQNILARGFEYDSGMRIDFLTSFESLEHFVNPLAEFAKMIDIAKTILVTTLLYPLPPPAPEAWWYYGLNHGQHIAFYSKRTLEYIANHFGLKIFTDGHHLHLFVREVPSIKNLNLFIKYRYLLTGVHKTAQLLREADKIFPWIKHCLPASRTFADMDLLASKRT